MSDFVPWVSWIFLQKPLRSPSLRGLGGFFFLARHEGFDPPAFWSVASLQASKGRFSVLSAPFAPPFRWFCETISHPLLSVHFLSWVKMWVRPQPQKACSNAETSALKSKNTNTQKSSKVALLPRVYPSRSSYTALAPPTYFGLVLAAIRIASPI